jgi:hypothetical protein
MPISITFSYQPGLLASSSLRLCEEDGFHIAREQVVGDSNVELVHPVPNLVLP